jgi:hypothetical protein
MRIILTLDRDTYRRLVLETRRTGRSLTEVVNAHLRRSLGAAEPAAQRSPFRVNARPMRIRPGIDLSNIEQLLDR